MLYLMHTIIQFIIYYYICMYVYIYIYIYPFLGESRPSEIRPVHMVK